MNPLQTSLSSWVPINLPFLCLRINGWCGKVVGSPCEAAILLGQRWPNTGNLLCKMFLVSTLLCRVRHQNWSQRTVPPSPCFSLRHTGPHGGCQLMLARCTALCDKFLCAACSALSPAPTQKQTNPGLSSSISQIVITAKASSRCLSAQGRVEEEISEHAGAGGS